MNKILIFFIQIYQWTIRPLIGSNCRFYPSCSNYGIESIQKHGCIKGTFRTLIRLLKCHPWHPGGHDPA